MGGSGRGGSGRGGVFCTVMDGSLEECHVLASLTWLFKCELHFYSQFQLHLLSNLYSNGRHPSQITQGTQGHHYRIPMPSLWFTIAPLCVFVNVRVCVCGEFLCGGSRQLMDAKTWQTDRIVCGACNVSCPITQGLSPGRDS